MVHAFWSSIVAVSTMQINNDLFQFRPAQLMKIENSFRKMENRQVLTGWYVSSNSSGDCRINARASHTNLRRRCYIRLWWTVIKPHYAIYTIICCACLDMGSGKFTSVCHLNQAANCCFRFQFSRMHYRCAWKPCILSIIRTYSICYSRFSSHSSEKNCANV